jgi:hypothetical protein
MTGRWRLKRNGSKRNANRWVWARAFVMVERARVGDILGWQGGIAPIGVQRALRHEAKRLGLKQRELATQLCLSRPQLSNLQQGRFGASAEAAERIRNFLIGSAKTVGGGKLDESI